MAGVSVFFRWIPVVFRLLDSRLCGNDGAVLVGAVRMTGALRGFRLEYIIFSRGGGILHYWMILREGVFGALGWCGWIGGLKPTLRYTGMTAVGISVFFRWIPVVFRLLDSRVRGNDGCGGLCGCWRIGGLKPTLQPSLPDSRFHGNDEVSDGIALRHSRLRGNDGRGQRKKSPTPGGSPCVNAPIVLFAVSSALPRADLRAARMRSSSISLSSAAS